MTALGLSLFLRINLVMYCMKDNPPKNYILDRIHLELRSQVGFQPGQGCWSHFERGCEGQRKNGKAEGSWGISGKCWRGTDEAERSQ